MWNQCRTSRRRAQRGEHKLQSTELNLFQFYICNENLNMQFRHLSKYRPIAGRVDGFLVTRDGRLEFLLRLTRPYGHSLNLGNVLIMTINN